MIIRQNIHNRLAFVLWGVALVAFLLAGMGLAIYQQQTQGERARELMEPYAQMIAVGVDPAVAFEDTQRATEILQTLSTNPQILEATLYLLDGRRLASYNRAGVPPSRVRQEDGIFFEDSRVLLVQELPRGARLHLSMALSEFEQQRQRMYWIFAVAVVVLLLVTLAQMEVLRRMIVRPISVLAEASERVRATGDYAHRVPASGDDEVGDLGRNFNAMMEAIETREGELHALSGFQHAILHNAAHGIISASPGGIVTSFNPAAEQLLGYSAQEIIGKQTPACWHDPAEIAAYATQLSETFGMVVQPGFEVFTVRPDRDLPEEREWTYLRKDGQRIAVNLSITVLRDERGRVTGYVGMVYDLSERKQAEEAIRKLNQELEQRVAERTAQLEATNKELEAFAYSVSHDLRTPLRAIDGFSKILLDGHSGQLDGEGRRLLNVVRDNTARMAQLIDDMLQFSRTGRMELSPNEIDMRRMVGQVVEELRSDTGCSNVVFQIGDLPSVRGDSAMMRQVMRNLLSNALKFSRSQPAPRIEVGASESEDEIIYHVKDNGVGFEMQFADKLFGVFQRLHSINEFEGTGIGLAIVKRIVTRHGGRVWAEGKVNGGATFYFALPRG
jgi:signal transduction histidine kinase